MGNEIAVVFFVVLFEVGPVIRFGVVGAQHDDDYICGIFLGLLELRAFLVGVVAAVHEGRAASPKILYGPLVAEHLLKLRWP